MSSGHETAAAAAQTPQATALYVYGVIPAADAHDWPGADGIDAPVQTVVEGDLAALVSPLAADRTPGLRSDLEAHRRVLELAIKEGTTIPMRFGIVMDDEHMVRERLLIKHAPELRDLVENLDGTVQMTVRAFYAENELLREVTDSQPEIQQRAAAIQGLSEMESRQERIDLGKLVSEAITARRDQDEQALVAQLTPFAKEIHVDPPGGERVALNAQLLVSRESRHELDEAVKAIGGVLQGRIALRYLGPMPPYSFSELSLEPNEE
jgi:hypothetical protein